MGTRATQLHDEVRLAGELSSTRSAGRRLGAAGESVIGLGALVLTEWLILGRFVQFVPPRFAFLALGACVIAMGLCLAPLADPGRSLVRRLPAVLMLTTWLLLHGWVVSEVSSVTYVGIRF